MIKKLLPLVLPLVGLGLGTGAGLILKPKSAPAEDAAHEDKSTAPAEGHGKEAETGRAEDGEEAAAEGAEETSEAKPEFVKLTNQFVVPILEKGRVVSLVILALNLEVETGKAEEVYSREPKLRDAFLQVLFDHANAGGFRGSFTDGSNLIYLRRALLERAKGLVGDIVIDVLISDIARQDT